MANQRSISPGEPSTRLPVTLPASMLADVKAAAAANVESAAAFIRRAIVRELRDAEQARPERQLGPGTQATN